MKLIVALLLITSNFAYANQTTIAILDKSYQWEIQVENCSLDPEKKAVVLSKPKIPYEKIMIKQDKKLHRCDVKRVEIIRT